MDRGLLKVSKPGILHVVLHYLYFPARQAAQEAAAELRSLGFTTEDSLGGDDERWNLGAMQRCIEL